MKSENFFHVAIIPDGNRRWARSHNMLDLKGHKRGLDVVFDLVNKANKLGIKYFTVWFFSTENWNRTKPEVKYLMDLAYKKFDKFSNEFIKNKVHFTHIGRSNVIPQKLADKFKKLEEKTKNFTNYYFNFAFDYGGREEITTAVKKIIKEKIPIEKIDEKTINDHLYTANIPDVDLIIRPGGESRLSGFLPWQSVYSEIYFCKKFFPDFNFTDLKKAVKILKSKDRRFGGNSIKEDAKYKKITK